MPSRTRAAARRSRASRTPRRSRRTPRSRERDSATARKGAGSRRRSRSRRAACRCRRSSSSKGPSAGRSRSLPPSTRSPLDPSSPPAVPRLPPSPCPQRRARAAPRCPTCLPSSPRPPLASPPGNLLFASGAPSSFERPFDLPLGISLGDVAPLVALLLAARDRQLDLHPPVLEIHPGRDDRHPLFAYRSVERVDLASVQEKLPRPRRLVVRAVPLRVDRDLEPVQPRLAVADVREGVRHSRAPDAQRLDLGAGQRDAGLDPLQELIVVTCSAVLGDRLLGHRTSRVALRRVRKLVVLVLLAAAVGLAAAILLRQGGKSTPAVAPPRV